MKIASARDLDQPLVIVDERMARDATRFLRASAVMLSLALLFGACAGEARPSTRTEATGTPPASSTALAPAAATAQATAAAPTVGITLETVAAADEISLSVTSPVSRGQAAIANAKTVPGADCTITVRYASGPSTAQGLSPKAADGAGSVFWSWTVGTDTTPGSWPVEVSCSTLSGLRAVARQLFTVR